MEAHDRLKASLERAIGFIRDSRNPDGLWTDFLTLAGESVYWVSGYVGYAMSREGAARGEPWLEEVGSKIIDRQGRDGGWGYGPGVPADADSTAWCLLFLSRLETENQESLSKATLFLLGHQSPVDGGFRTYAAPRQVGRYMMLDEGVSFEGWASSQTCVTAVASQALLEAGSLQGTDEALEYIRRSQTEEGYWEPYWWTEKIYATVHCMEALKVRGGSEDAELLNKAQDWIASTQLAEGAWGGPTTGQGLPFPTALAISGLMLAPRPLYEDKIRAGIDWLVTQQLTDGSWNSHHILRIPHPSMKEPWRQTQWKRDGRAINAVIRDQRRLYTTATALTAISKFRERSSGSEVG